MWQCARSRYCLSVCSRGGRHTFRARRLSQQDSSAVEQRHRAAPTTPAIVEAATSLTAPGQSYLIISAATILGRLAGSSATKPSPPACKRQVTPSASRARWQHVQGGRGRMRRRQGGGTAYPVSACERGMCTHLRACPQKQPAFRETAPRLHEPSVGSGPTAGYNTSLVERSLHVAHVVLPVFRQQ